MARALVSAAMVASTLSCAAATQTEREDVEHVVATVPPAPASPSPVEPEPEPEAAAERELAPSAGEAEVVLPPPAPAGSAAEIESYITEVFGPHARTAKCIAALESTGTRGHYNVKARGRAGEISLFQVMARYHAWRLAHVEGSDLWDWRTNVRVARHIFNSQGWRPWTVRGRCGV